MNDDALFDECFAHLGNRERYIQRGDTDEYDEASEIVEESYREAIEATFDMLRSKGVPIELLSEGRMVKSYALWCAECRDLPGMCVAKGEHEEAWHIATTYGVLVDDTTDQRSGE